MVFIRMEIFIGTFGIRNLHCLFVSHEWLIIMMKMNGSWGRRMGHHIVACDRVSWLLWFSCRKFLSIPNEWWWLSLLFTIHTSLFVSIKFTSIDDYRECTVRFKSLLIFQYHRLSLVAYIRYDRCGNFSNNLRMLSVIHFVFSSIYVPNDTAHFFPCLCSI